MEIYKLTQIICCESDKNMPNSDSLNILDLPDEILILIFNELNMVDVLHSFMNLNERFNRLIFDPLYIQNLNMTAMITKSAFDHIFSIDNQVFDQICKDILPQVQHQVNKLTLESTSVERILRSFHFPELKSLTLINFHEETLLQYLTGIENNKIIY